MHHHYSGTRLILLMGATGCGKSTIGEQLAQHLKAAYIEGDSFHTPENKAKMSRGIALTDDDRWPWLKIVGDTLRRRPGKTVGSCSALKRSYRDHITKQANEPVLFIHLCGSKAVLADRLAGRHAHFMDKNLLQSQLELLEAPDSDEHSFSIDIDAGIGEIVDNILQKLRQAI